MVRAVALVFGVSFLAVGVLGGLRPLLWNESDQELGEAT
jgi:hypothetical protein